MSEDLDKDARVAIVVATHQMCYPLDRCLAGHLALCEKPEDLIFVDNGSGGDLAIWAKEHFPDITVITRETNGFFCGGYNSGIRDALDRGYDYVLIVNADTEVMNPGYVDELVAVAEKQRLAAFIGPRVYWGDEQTVQNTILFFPWFFRYLFHWVRAPFDRVNRSAAAAETTPVEFLNGVCVLCRSKALQEFGLMDEVMGGYVEDADWSGRAIALGWQSLFTPVASIIHHQAPAEYQHYSLKTFMLRRNHVYWHYKHQRYLQAAGFAFCSTLLGGMRTLKAMILQEPVAPHWHALKVFTRTSLSILRGREPGDWFGPPLGDYPVRSPF